MTAMNLTLRSNRVTAQPGTRTSQTAYFAIAFAGFRVMVLPLLLGAGGYRLHEESPAGGTVGC